MDNFRLQILIKNINKNPTDYTVEIFKEITANLPADQIDMIWNSLLEHPHPVTIATHVADLITILIMKGLQ